MKPCMTNQLKKAEAARRRNGAPAAGPARATVVLAAMEHPAPPGPVVVTGQKPRHGEGE
jgi:hypothetical protein